MDNLIQEWVLNNLRLYGNCSLNPQKAKLVESNKIIQYLKNKGFNCVIENYVKQFTEINKNMKLEEVEEEFYIIRVV